MSVCMAWNNVSHQCYTSRAAFHFFSIYRITASTFLSYTYHRLLCFVLLCICRARAYEPLISSCPLFHFELRQRCSTLTINEQKNNRGREKCGSKKTDMFFDTENLFFVWIQMKWITFVHVLIKSFLTCYIFHACSFFPSIPSLCGSPSKIVYVLYNFVFTWARLLVECPFTF